MKKPLPVVYLNNAVAFLLYKILKKILIRKESSKNGMLFINHGNLGDILISTLLLENEKYFSHGEQLYLMVKHEFAPLFEEYDGRFKIIYWNYKKYKYSLRYRINFIKHLRRLNLKVTYNLTSARGITSDDVALLSGANKVYCINSRWKYLRKLFADKMNSEYDYVYFTDVLNEYQKHILLLKTSTKIGEIQVSNSHTILISQLTAQEIKSADYSLEYIVLAPFASDIDRSWGLVNYRQIALALSKRYHIKILGSAPEIKYAKEYFSGIENCSNLVGTMPILDVLKIIRKTRLFIGNDSGLTHAALKFNVPLIAIIGGGNYEMYFPYEPSKERKYFAHKMDCFGCEWNCIHSQRFCLTNIFPDAVLSAAEKILTEKK